VVFDTIEGDWSTVSFPSNGDIYDDGASIGNKVFFTGLRDGEVRGPDFESEYVAETNSWSASIDLAPNTLFTSMPLNERHVTTIGETALFIGGRPGGGAWSTDVWLYNNTTSHMRVTNLPGVVPRAVSTRLGNKLYITGQTTNKINVYNADALTDFTVDDDITACGGTPFTLTASGASSYTWQPDPALSTTTGSSVVVTPDASGSEWFTLYLTGVDDDGWESTYRIKVTVKPSPAKPVATLDTSGLVNVLTSNFESGNQWFSNNVEIEDAVTQQFFLVNPGSYSVQVTVDGCKSPMSDPVNYQILGDDDDGRSFKTIVYPNPVSDRLNFQWGGFSDHEKIDVKIVDVIGRTVYHKESSTTDGGIDASSFTDGIYFVIASQREARQVIRVIKK